MGILGVHLPGSVIRGFYVIPAFNPTKELDEVEAWKILL
jgi:hypothetical protein